MLRHILATVVTLAFAVPPAAAQEIRTLDLARGSTAVDVDAGTKLQLRIESLLPNRDKYTYTWEIRLQRDTIPALELPARTGIEVDSAAQTSSGGVKDEEETCKSQTDEAEAARTKLIEASSESQVAELLKAAEDAINDADQCDSSAIEGLQAALAKVEVNTREELPGQYRIEAGSKLEVTIRRYHGSEEQRVWTYEFDGGPGGRWLMSYGFTFIEDRSDRYFTDLVEPDSMDVHGEQAASPMFRIMKEKDRRRALFAPSVLFRWQDPGDDHEWSPVAGFGYDLSNPILFGGYSYTYQTNLTVTVGVVLRKGPVLAGRYSEDGELVAEDLDFEALHEETYSPRAYFGIGLRLGSDPFAGDLTRSAAKRVDDTDTKKEAQPDDDAPAEEKKPTSGNQSNGDDKDGEGGDTPDKNGPPNGDSDTDKAEASDTTDDQ